MRRTPRPIEGLDEPHYRVSDIALTIGVAPTTILRWIHKEKLNAKRCEGYNGMFLVPRSSLAQAKLLRDTAEDQPEALSAPAGI
jgi:transposase-like protein